MPGDTNRKLDVFLRIRGSNPETRRLSVSSSGVQGNGTSSYATITSDGRYVIFQSDASNLVPGDTNGKTDIFRHDTLTGQTIRASVGNGGGQSNGVSRYYGAISENGRYVAFHSTGSNLAPGDSDSQSDVFVRDLWASTTELVSVSSAGAAGNGASAYADISDDGRYVVFVSKASNLVTPASNRFNNVYLRDRIDGKTIKLSQGVGDAPINGDCSSPKMSSDARYVTFGADATNLVRGDTNGVSDVFLLDRQSGVTRRLTVSGADQQGNRRHYQHAISGDGRTVVFSTESSNLVPNDNNAKQDGFMAFH